MTWKDGETISPLGLNRIEEAVASMNESYTPTVWEVGDLITAEKLNKIEEGIAGVQPSGKKEITSTAEVNVANYATAQVIDEDLVAGNIKKDVDILGVVGSYEPEVPASDFSTANVSVNNTSANDAVIQIANVIVGIATFAGIQASITKNLEVVLYNGVSGFDVPEGFTVSAVSGDITHEDGYVEITGDGTVTLATA